MFYLIILLFFTTMVISDPATNFEKAVCECCKKYDETSVCDDATIKDLRRPRLSYDKCFFKITARASGSAPYGNRREEINLEHFSKWCNIIVSNHGYFIDTLTLSWNGLHWSDDLKQIMYDSMYDEKNKNNYDIFSLDDLILCTSAKFWKDFYEQITNKKEHIILCLLSLEECYATFLSYFYNENFLGCSGERVKLFIDSIKAGLPESMNIVERLSPTRVGRFSSCGIVGLFCAKIGYLANIDNNIYWTDSQLKPFLFVIAKFHWPIGLILSFLRNNSPAGLSVDIPTSEPYKHSTIRMSLESLLNLINILCISVEISNGEIVDYEYLWGDRYDCQSDVYKLKTIYNIEYDLSNEIVEELVTYNYFDLLNSKKFGTAAKEQGKPKNPKDILNMMNYLANECGFKYKYTKMWQNDKQSLGIRSFLNFMILYQTCCIGGGQIRAIIKKLNEITTLNTLISSLEKDENVIKKEDYIENDDPNSLYNIRKTFDYEPVYDSVRTDENEKTWGKVVFVAIHVIAIRYNADLIEDNEVAAALVRCLDDLIASKIFLGMFCDLFPKNPFFGEFDNVIREKYYINE